MTTEGSEHREIARNAATSYAARGLVGLSALLLTPYLFRRLGVDGFGTFSIAFALATIARLLETGFSGGVTRLVADARARGDRDELAKLVGAALALMAGLGVVGAAGFVGGAYALGGLAPEAHRDAFRDVLLLLAATMIVRIPLSAYAAVLNGYQRFDLSNASSMVSTVVFSVGAVVAVEAGGGVFGAGAAYAAGLAAGGIVYAGALRRVDSELGLFRRGSGRAGRRIVGFSSFTLLADSMVFVAQRMDVVIIAAVRDAVAAAPYAAAVKLQSALQALTLPFMNLLMPMVADLWTRGRRDEVVARLALATRITVQVTVPVAVAAAVFARDLVDLWLGAGAPEVTALIVVVLMAVQTATLAATPSEKALVGIGRVRLVGGISLLEGLANIGATVTLVWLYGALGAALGTLLTSALIGPLKIPLACRSLGVPLGRFVRSSLGAALASSVPALAAVAIVYAVVPGGPLRALAGLGAALALTAAVGVAQVGPRRLVELVWVGLGSQRVIPGTGLVSGGASVQR